ncbi:MAG: hypothetical protein CME62_13315 [Halobacteriovoraceae bacterium]|nr:hypothetical protein [Halobacteriovoraceae bacterium]|tara:strand:+ start:8889 stop:10124 length:1236 start_codon:yes stop_codon:yes gene_type:complete
MTKLVLDSISHSELVIQFLGTLSCLILAWGSLIHNRRSPTHLSLGILLLFLFGGGSFRLIGWATSHFLYYKISYAFYLFLPLVLAIFTEKATRYRLSSWYKIIVLLALIVLFPLYMQLNTFPEGQLRYIYLAYHMMALLMLFWASSIKITSLKSKNEKSVLIAICFVSLLTLIFVCADLLSHWHGIAHLKLSSLGILIFNYLMASIIFSTGSFSFRHHLKSIGRYLLINLSLGAILIFASTLPRDEIIIIILLSFVLQIFVNILQNVINNVLRTRGHTIQKLISLKRDDIKSFLKCVESLEEVNSITLLSQDYLQKNKLLFIFDHEFNNLVFHRDEINKMFNSSQNENEKNRLEALEFIFNAFATDYLIIIPEHKMVLTIEFTYLMNRSYFNDLITYLGREVDFLAQRERR